MKARKSEKLMPERNHQITSTVYIVKKFSVLVVMAYSAYMIVGMEMMTVNTDSHVHAISMILLRPWMWCRCLQKVYPNTGREIVASSR